MKLRDFVYPRGNPSLLSANKNCLQEEVKKAANAGAYFIHIDIMDGIFVDNISFSYDIAKNIFDPHVGHPLLKDAHLMVANPLNVLDAYASISNIVTFHYEAINNKEEIIKGSNMIRKHGAFSGLAINPETPIESIIPFISYFDLILLMTVHPGKGGQTFDKNGIVRIKQLREELNKLENPPILEIDGGINENIASKVIEAGAELLVAGSYLFGHDDFNERFLVLEKK